MLPSSNSDALTTYSFARHSQMQTSVHQLPLQWMHYGNAQQAQCAGISKAQCANID